jgi:tetratricopeptide (TPR) repeat protein
MGPLLNRLHYRLRLQIVDNLLQRLRCSTCHQQATDLLAACALLGFGNTRSIGNFPSTMGTVHQTLEKDLEADSSFKTSLPQLPFAVRNLIQDDRADLFTFDEITSALQTVLSELLTKMNIGTNCRSTQILSSTLGRLFTLIGRHEEAALCFYTALTHRPKPKWRTYNKLSTRLSLYAEPGDMRMARDSNQLIEAEHDLFLFSLVHELDILGRQEEAIRELQGIRDITIAPNGLYLERETGRSFHIVIHRSSDARNLLVRLLLEREMLGEIMHMGQEYDLPDLVGLYGFTPEVVPGQAQQCFATTEEVALGSFRSGRFDHAERLQRRLLNVCSEKKIHKSIAETNMVRADLALTLSRSEVVESVEEANKIQQELIQLAGEDKDLLFNLRLNNIYTLTALGHLDHALLQIEAVSEDDQEWREVLEITNQGTRTLRLGTPHLWLYEVPDGLRTTFVIHRALLATCPFIKGKEDELKFIMLLCANPRTTTPLYNYNELIDFLTSEILKSTASVLQQIVLWDRLICLLTCVGIGWELPEKFDLAQTCVDEMTNTVSIMSENHDFLENETHVVHLTALALRMKAQYLNTVRGFGISDHTFWDNAVNAHRRAALTESSKGKAPGGGYSLARLCLAGMLKQKVLAFHDSEEAQVAIECYSEIVQEHENLVFARVEYAHLCTELDLIDGNLTHEEDPLQVALVECVHKLGPTHLYTNQARTMIAHSLEHRGLYVEARELLSEAAESVRSVMGTNHPQALRAQFNLFKFQNKRQVELGLHPYSSPADLSSLRYSAAKILGKEHVTTQEYLGCYALSLERDEKAVKQATALKRDVVDALQRAHETAHTKVLQERTELAGMLCRQGGQDHLDGRSEFALSLRSAVNLLGVSHPTTREIWRQCVSAISDLGQELGKALSNVAPPAEAITSSALASGHAHSPRPLDPTVYETYLSIYLLGTNHPLTTMLRNKVQGINPLWNGSVPSDEDWKDCFPLPPPPQIGEQWTEFLEPLRLIFNKQMVHHQQELEAALEEGRESFAASGGLRLDFSGGRLGEEELPVLRVMRPDFGVMRA